MTAADVTVIEDYGQDYVIVREAGGKYSVRWWDLVLNEETDEWIRVVGRGGPSYAPAWTTREEAWAFACGYEAGAQENM